MIRYHAAWVVPVTAPPIRRGTVVEHEGRIVYVGPRAEAPPGHDDDLGQVILCPGLVNAHTHLELTVMRGFLENLAFQDWIIRLTTAKRSVLSRDDLLDSARLGIAEGVRNGVTTFADTCDSGVALDAMLEHGVRGIMYQEVFGPDPDQCDESMRELRKKLDRHCPRATPLVAVGISPHAPYTVSDRLFAAVAEHARRSGLAIAVHIAESEAESALVERGDGPFASGLRRRGLAVARRASSPVALLEATGLLRERPLLIHGVRLSGDDVQRIAAHDAPLAHCPVSNAKLGHGIAPLLALREAGVRVGLGSDSVASNDRMDILHEAHVASLLQSALARRADALPAEAALELATLGGARALGLDAEIGSLDVGKSADLAAFAMTGAGGVPLQAPTTALVHSLGGADAVFVTVEGRVLLRDGILAASDPALATRVDAAAARLRDWLARVPRPEDLAPPPSPTR